MSVEYYLQGGLKVFTREHHLNRGTCCNSTCRHCPWNGNTIENVFIDMDGTLCDFISRVHEIVPGSASLSGQEFEDAIDAAQSIPGFYKSIRPYDGAIEAYNALSSKYNCYILSAPSWNDPHSYSEKREWVEEHLGKVAEKKLILSHDKGLFSGRAIIDDRKKYNVDKFTGEHVHIFTSKFPDWNSVLKHLI